VWAAGVHPDVELLIVDVDATLVLAHNDAKQGGAGPYKHSFGFFIRCWPTWTARLPPISWPTAT
jgi:hypothetical protein